MDTPHGQTNQPTNRPKWEGREAVCGKPGRLPLCLQNMGLVTALVIAGCTAGILLGLPSKNPCTKCLGDPTPTALSEEDNVGQKRKKIETSTPLLLPCPLAVPPPSWHIYCVYKILGSVVGNELKTVWTQWMKRMPLCRGFCSRTQGLFSWLNTFQSTFLSFLCPVYVFISYLLKVYLTSL